MRTFARVTKAMAVGSLALGILGTVSGLVHTFVAMSAAGLSQSDKQRILSNGTIESVYNTAFGIIVSGPLFGSSWWARRRARGSTETR